MNRFTGIARFSNTAELRYTSDNQTPFTTRRLELMEPFNREGKTFEIESTTWGKAAQSVMDMPMDTIVLISGQINVNTHDRGAYKESLASLSVSKVIEVSEFVAFNEIHLMGNAGGDPEVQYFESERNVAKVSLAVRRTRDQTNWFALEAWGKVATTFSEYVAKGSSFGASGYLKLSGWTDRNTGETRTKPVVTVDQLTLGAKADNNGAKADNNGDSDQERGNYTSSSRASTPAASSSVTALAKTRANTVAQIRSADTTQGQSKFAAGRTSDYQEDFDDIPF